ncbi:MAG: sugar-binding protein [Spirochaetota bacterium]
MIRIKRSQVCAVFGMLMTFLVHNMYAGAIAFWPLNEGEGTLLREKISEKNGVFFSVQAGTEMSWRDGSELFFPGGKGGAHVKIESGGKILSGKTFEVSLEVRVAEPADSGYMLTSKHASTKTGGFLIFYDGRIRKMNVDFSDGNMIFKSAFELQKQLAADRWQKVMIRYDGAVLTLFIDDVKVKDIELSGCRLAESQYPLLIGGYFNNLGESFGGSIRNVSLTKLSAAGVSDIPSVQRTGVPTIDGTIDDACWQNAQFQSQFVHFYKDKPADPQTEFAVNTDGTNLYLAMRCNDQSPEKILKRPRERDNTQMWDDDVVEIFLDPDASGDHYFHFAISAGNVQYDALITRYGMQQNVDFNADWRSAVQIGSSGWTAEIAIPLSEILVKSHGSEDWHFNVCRDCKTGEKKQAYSTWGTYAKGEPNKGFHSFKLFRIVTGFSPPLYSTAATARVAADRKKWQLDVKPSAERTALVKIRDFWMVGNNCVVPNWFVSLAPGKDIQATKTSYDILLPEGVELIWTGSISNLTIRGGGAEYATVKNTPVSIDGKLFTPYTVTPVVIHHGCTVIGPFYLRSSLADGVLRDMYFSARWDGGRQDREKIALVTKAFPSPGMPKKLIAPIAWMNAWQYLAWPDFPSAYESLGFNCIGTHGLYDNKVDLEQRITLLNQMRERGFSIMLVDSPFLGMHLQSPSEVRSLDRNGAPKSERDVCPVYRGALFQDEVRRVADLSAQIRPDIVNLDIECYQAGAFAGKTEQCSRCTEYIKNRGVAPGEAMTDLGVDIMRHVKVALNAAADSGKYPYPRLGTYHTEPGGFVYQDTFNFDKLYREKAADFCHPVNYKSQNAKFYGERMRELRAMLPDGDIIPWVTAGYTLDMTIEYPTEWVYNYVLETYGSGLRGIYWFLFEKFEGSDLYYYAKAMEAVNPVSELIYDSKPLENVKGSIPSVSVNAIANGRETVLLLSDYSDKASIGRIEITLPAELSGTVWDLARKKICGRMSGRMVIIDNWQPIMPEVHTALYYIGPRSF